MKRVIHAELVRLCRPRTMVLAAAAALVFSVVATLAVFSSARPSGVPATRGTTTLAALAGPGGGTQAFAVGASFVGFLVYVVFIAVIAGEFSGGTFRALLLRDPNRLRLLAGKVAGLFL